MAVVHKVHKDGAVKLPRPLLKEAGLKPGLGVVIRVSNGSLIIERAHYPRAARSLQGPKRLRRALQHVDWDAARLKLAESAFQFWRTQPTTSMTPSKPGDVVLLPFPFTDLSTTKQRPAVVVSAETFNARQQDVIVVAITSQIPSTMSPEDYRLSSEEQRTAGLPKPSLVKCGKLLTIDQRLIRRLLGRLPPQTLSHVTQRLFTILGEGRLSPLMTIR